MKTFLDLPSELCDPMTARFHIVPIPYDVTVCFQKGTFWGPDAILDVSDQMEHVDEETFVDFTRLGIATWPAIDPAGTPKGERARIEEVVRRYDLFRPDRFPIFLGGEHSISAPLVKLASERYKDLTVLQFDAHSDLRDEFGSFGPYSHASVMRRILEYDVEIVQVGIRSFPQEDLEECPEQVHQFITPLMLEERFSDVLALLLDRLSDHVYITFDMDAFDPSVAPGVGTPEPGGLTWRQVTRILRKVFSKRNVIGADIVETLPVSGGLKTTEFVAARLAAKIMTYSSIAARP